MTRIIFWLYVLAAAVIVIAIGYSSHYLFDLAGDSLRYSYGKTGWEYAQFNYYKGSGRWAQGLTNDFRLYRIRGIMAAVSVGFFLFSVFYFFKHFFSKRLEALVLTIVFYLAVSFSLVRYYDFTFNMCMVMSYTIGMGMTLSSIPVLIENFAQFKWRRVLILTIITIVLPGLLEVYGVVFMFIIFSFIVYHYLNTRKIRGWSMVLLVLALISNAFTYYSPGNIARRARNQSDAGFDVTSFMEIWGTTLNKLLIPVTIFLLLVVIFITVTNQENFKKLSGIRNQILVYTSTFIITVLPLILIVYAVGEKAPAFKRVLNVATVFTLIFISGIIFLFIRLTRFKLKLKKNLYHSLLLLFLVLGVWLYSIGKSFEANKVYTQIATGDLKKYWNQEMARRDFLLADTAAVHILVPALDHRTYKGTVVGLGNEHKRKDGFTMHHTYNDIFNSGKKVEIVKTYPDPRIFSCIYFFETNPDNRFVEIEIDARAKVFYVEKYNCLLIEKQKETFPREIILNTDTGEQRINVPRQTQPYTEYYKSHPNMIGFVVDKDIFDGVLPSRENISLSW